MKYFAFILVLIWSPLTQPALSSDTLNQLAQAQLNYAAGKFNQARIDARQLETAEGYALACQAGLVIGGFQERGAAAVASLHEALQDCRLALELEPTHYRAGLSHAIALGFEGQRLRRTAYARASKQNIEALIKQYPNNALATGALGGWHAAVSLEGMFARAFLGASRAKAKALYSEALKLPDAELPLCFEYIRFLASGSRQERTEALKVLAQVGGKPPKGALEKLLKDKSLQIRNAIELDDKKMLERALEEATPFNGIDVWGSLKKTGIRAFPLEIKGSEQ